VRTERDALGGTSALNDTLGCRGVDAASLNGGGAVHTNLMRGDDPPGSSVGMRLAEGGSNAWRPGPDRLRWGDGRREHLEGSTGDGEARGGSAGDQPLATVARANITTTFGSLVPHLGGGRN
jgi:hypothetical protein